MIDKDYSQLKNNLSKDRKTLLKHLSDNDISKAESLLKKITITENFINQKQQHKRKIVSILLILIILIIITLLYYFPVRTSEISAKLINTGFTIHLKNIWQAEKVIGCNTVEINRINELTVFPLLKQYKNASRLLVYGEKIVLNKIEVSDNALIDIDAYRNNGLLIILRRGYVKYEFLNHNGGYQINDTDQIKSFNSLTTTTVFSIKSDTCQSTSDPIIIRLIGLNYMNLSFESFDSLYFAKPDRVNSGSFQSTIISGDILEELTKKNLKLNSFNKLFLLNDSTVKFSSVKTNDGLETNFIGRVHELFINTDKKKSLKPSILEYLYFNKPLAILWSSVVFLTGLIWSIRNTLFR
jgi:hypothetical protein